MKAFNYFPRLTLAIFSAVMLGQLTAKAVPYASAVINNAGTVSFVLNEAADNVKVVLDGGASTLDLGAQGPGTHSFSLGGATRFEIVVSKNGVAPWTLISSDANTLLQFTTPRGVAVNMNPANPTFGRIYVANSAVATTTSGRSVGDGIYVLNADQSDVLGRGNTASTAGLPFDASGGTAAPGANSPWRLEVGEDNKLYIADFSTNTGCIYYTDADVTSGGQVLDGVGWNRPNSQNTVHTTIGGSPIIRGSLAAGTFTVWSIDGSYNRPSAGSLNRLMRWDVGAGPLPYSAAPTLLANPIINNVADVTTDLDRGPDGKFYLMQNRAAGNEAGVFVVDTDGATLLWDSLTTSRSISNNAAATDILRISRAVKISADGMKIALIRDDMQTWVVPLINGIPDLPNRELVSTAGTSSTLGRDVCWDIAGNLYALSSGNQLLRIFSPGGTTRATTRSDGTFTLVRPPPLSVEVPDAVAGEQGADRGTFSIYRTGDTSQPLTVQYTLSGTASNGVDYTNLPLVATIQAGATNVIITIEPIDDSEAELTESVILTLVSTPDYDLRAPVSGTINIVDNEYPNVVTLAVTDPNMYEPLSTDTATFTLTRLGDTNLDLFISLNIGGTAINGVDYTIPSTIQIPKGAVTRTFTLSPIDDAANEGDETVTLTVVADLDYNPGTPASATAVIRDDDPVNCVLFSDNFDTDTSNNWLQRFGANNGIFDATVTFAFDYSSMSIPPAPHSSGGSTRGLFVAVNKNEATAAGGAAGINFYPLGQSFSGNYALRFDMYLSYGTAGTTEHALAGLNHSGAMTNRVTQSADANNTTRGADGIFVAIETDGSANLEYGAYTSTNPGTLPFLITNQTAAVMAPFVPSPPYTAAGSPGNGPGSPKAWSEVELSQSNNVVTLKVNGALVYQITNTYGFTSGNVMIGHNDQFDSIGSAANFVIFDNVRVVSLDTLTLTILCPSNRTFAADANCQAVVPDFTSEAIVSGNCGAATLSQVPAAGARVGPGTTPVMLRAVDSGGNSSTCTVSVVVVDTASPAITTCPTNLLLSLDSSCQATLPDLRPQVSATDNCGIATTNQSPPPGTMLSPGLTVVVFTVADAAGNTVQCSNTVTVADTTPPSISCPGNVLTECAGSGGTQVSYTASASDNCPGVMLSCNPASGSSFPLGATTVRCTATDVAGNSNVCTFTVTVRDTVPPAISCPTNRTVNCTGPRGAQVSFVATASDSCDSSVRIECTPPSGSEFPVGTNTVNCTATDASGNSNQCSFIIIVEDPTPVALRIRLEGMQAVISWPQTCTTYQLLQATNLLHPVPWQPVSAPVTTVGNDNVVTLQLADGNLFFELRRK